MTANYHAGDDSVRISAEDFKQRFERAEPLTVLDARNREPWEASTLKVKGAMRWTGRIDPSWPAGRLTVVY